MDYPVPPAHSVDLSRIGDDDHNRIALVLSEPVKCHSNISFRFKVLFPFVAGINILIFHSSKIYRHMGE